VSLHYCEGKEKIHIGETSLTLKQGHEERKGRHDWLLERGGREEVDGVRTTRDTF
jgi:hypothetical protein